MTHRPVLTGGGRAEIGLEEDTLHTQAAMAEGHGIHQLDRDLKGLSTPAAWWQLQALNLGYSDPEDGTIDTKHTSSNGGNGMEIWQRRAGRDRNT